MEPNTIHSISPLMQINWRPGIGDPTFFGWLTVLAYFAAFLFCGACAKRIDTIGSVENAAIHRRFWWFIALVLLLLGLNKQLDFQTLITEVGKVIAKRQGWYEQRRAVQTLFITGIFCGGLFSLMVAYRAFRKVWKEYWLAIAGLIFLVVFVVIRAASFHHMDLFLGGYITGFKISWILELGGIICILISAVCQLKRGSRKVKESDVQKPVFL